MSRILVISDLHEPYAHPRAYQFLRRIRKQFRTTQTVCIGDEIDAHQWGHWAKCTDAHGASRELDEAIKALGQLKRFDDNIKFCNSNHVERANKRIEETGTPSRFVRPWRDVIEAPKGWIWADEWVIDGIRFFHGDGYNGAQAMRDAALDSRGPVVFGHLHGLAGITYHAATGGTVWGMAVGCLIDVRAPVFRYAKHDRKKPLLGCGVIVDGTPFYVPFK